MVFGLEKAEKVVAIAISTNDPVNTQTAKPSVKPSSFLAEFVHLQGFGTSIKETPFPSVENSCESKRLKIQEDSHLTITDTY